MELTIALDRYDRHMPFFNGTVKPPEGMTLRALEIGESSAKRDGMHRHARMLHDLEFDICELSLASFITAVAADPDFPVVGIPVFPRRLFSMGQMYVNADAGIEGPDDLIGRRVGIHAFQVTLSVLAKGDLKSVYGVPWERIDWVCMNAENQPIAFPEGVSVERMPDGADMGEMLIQGDIDALFSPQPRKSMLEGTAKVRRLFRDSRAEEIRYFRNHGFYPIMHLIGIRRDRVAENPGLPGAVMEMWEDAKRQAYEFYDDSNYALLAWVRGAYEEQRDALGRDPWPSGLAANRANLDRFIGYCHDQGLISAVYPAERLFDPSVHAT